MFWNFHFNSSGIDTLLAKEDVTLKEILDEDDILQECKTQNTKLIDFLSEDENLKQILHLIVDEPPDDVEETAKYKYKNIACEVLTIDIYAILDKVASNEEYLNIIWEFIEAPPPLNPLVASFFSKVISILICRKGQETFEYLKKHDAVNKFIVHIGTSAIMELFVKMVTVVETQEQRIEISKWLDEENLIGKLIELLNPSGQEEKHYNISQLLSELIRIGRDAISQYTESEDPLLVTLEKKETVQKLLETSFSDMNGPTLDSSIMAVISILISMMEIKRPVIEGMEELITQVDLERIANGVHSTLLVLSEQMQNFYEVLQKPPNIEPLEMTFGKLDPPLGKVRLYVASLICTAVSTNTKMINEAIAQTGIMNCLLDLFARYEWNNFLHTNVQNCLIAIMNAEIGLPEEEGEERGESESEKSTQRPLDPLLKNLFNECDIVKTCISLWKENQNSESENVHRRKGYMGHLTKIMNEIVNAKERGPNHEHIKSLFNELPDSTREEWNEIVSNSLEVTNLKNVITEQMVFSDSDNGESDDEVYLEGTKFSRGINISSYDGTLQQAFENYQVQPMTNEFIESFGYDEANVDDAENMKNPFDEVGNIDFSINANEVSDNEKLFESICEQKIKPFDDSDDDDEDEDLWEEKQLTFTSTSEPRQSTNAIKSDSSSDEENEDEENKSSSLNGSNKQTTIQSHKEDEKMEVDSTENDNKGWWTADFSNMDVHSSNSNDSENWATTVTDSSTPLSSSGEAFADFTDISKFEISNDAESNNPPVAMETEGSPKPTASSVYEVKMEEEGEEDKTTTTTDNNKSESSPSKLTQITVKSVRSPAPSSENVNEVTVNDTNEKDDTTSSTTESNTQESVVETSEGDEPTETSTTTENKIVEKIKEYDHIELTSDETKHAIQVSMHNDVLSEILTTVTTTGPITTSTNTSVGENTGTSGSLT